MGDTDQSEAAQAALLARALAAQEKAQSRNEYYTLEEVLQDLAKLLQKSGSKARP